MGHPDAETACGMRIGPQQSGRVHPRTGIAIECGFGGRVGGHRMNSAAQLVEINAPTGTHRHLRAHFYSLWPRSASNAGSGCWQAGERCRCVVEKSSSTISFVGKLRRSSSPQRHGPVTDRFLDHGCPARGETRVRRRRVQLASATNASIHSCTASSICSSLTAS